MPTLRPVILAAGLGTRLRPRTDHLPKPLLPVAGRPLLWYAIQATRHPGVERPTVVVDYKAELLEAYFQDEDVDLVRLQNRSMAEAVLEVAEQVAPADAYVCMSSDVLVPPQVIAAALAGFQHNKDSCHVALTRLPHAGHKKWHFEVEQGRLVGVDVGEERTHFERAALIIRHDCLLHLGTMLSRPVRTESNPDNLQPFNEGWILLLRLMIEHNVPVGASMLDIPVCNVNVAEDLRSAEAFVQERLAGI